MAAISQQVEQGLKTIFGERMRTDRIERKMYSFDIGALPYLIKPFVPAGLAGAVVRPENEAQIVELVKFAYKENIKLVPRGASTSGYGGVLPSEGAVVVDMSGMDKIIAIDTNTKNVTVQPGIIWEQLQRQINIKDLDLRVYPSSLPSSTVGGWLAQGGSGFGSYEYGPFKENVLSATVVLPQGDVKTFTGQELSDYIADAEGISGIITEIFIALRDHEAEIHRVVSLPDAACV